MGLWDKILRKTNGNVYTIYLVIAGVLLAILWPIINRPNAHIFLEAITLLDFFIAIPVLVFMQIRTTNKLNKAQQSGDRPTNEQAEQNYNQKVLANAYHNGPKCPRCGGTHIQYQAVSNTQTKGKGCAYWLFIGWWLETLLWLFVTLPMLLFKLFGSKGKTVTKVDSYAVCQQCGNKWKV